MVEHGLPYVAEVCKRTKSDRKGGHLAVRKSDGRIVLRDTRMVAEGEERFFRDIKRHSTFNANNLWIDLEVLRERMTAKQGVLGLPIIVNRKNVDPADAELARGHPDGVGDGHGDRGVRGLGGDPRPAHALPAGEDDERPARHPVRLLLPRR